MEKADRACLSARALMELGDVDGACNRAYETGRLLKRAEEIRLVADYRNDSVEMTDAQKVDERCLKF